jgi:hypothetical protein
MDNFFSTPQGGIDLGVEFGAFHTDCEKLNDRLNETADTSI